MKNTNLQSRRCLGRNLNLRRCGRILEKGYFCGDHKFQPILLAFFIIFTVGTAAIQYCDFFKSFQPNDRDIIIAKQYRMAINLFLVKFRLNLVCLPDINSLDKDIIEVFDPDHPKKAVKVNKITPELITKLFTLYDFSKPVGDNCEFWTANKQRVKTVTVSDLFIHEIKVLNKNCSKILLKYASAGQPKLINKIEIMKIGQIILLALTAPKIFLNLKKMICIGYLIFLLK